MSDEAELIASLPEALGVPSEAKIIELKHEISVEGESWFIRYMAHDIVFTDNGPERYLREFTAETFVPRRPAPARQEGSP